MFKIIDVNDGFAYKIERKKNIKIKAYRGFSEHVDDLAKLKDTGNGYIVSFDGDRKPIKLEYCHAEYLFLLLREQFESRGVIYSTLTSQGES